jgi:hypothetical protein
MPKPPPPPRAKPAPRVVKPAEPAEEKSPVEPLAEVERALSILHGRHPEAVRAERETQAALLQKKTASEVVATRIAHQERRAWVLRIAAGTAALLLAVAAWWAYSSRASRAAAVEASLAPALERLATLGFSRVPASTFATRALDLSVDEPTCFVALASRSPGDGALRVERPSGTVLGSDSIAWCTCGAERMTARLDADESPGGLAVMRAPAPDVGGDYGLSFMNPRATVLAPADECSSASLDAWIDKGRAPVTPEWAALADARRKGLHDDGFTPVGSARSSLPLAIVPGEKEACILAWSAASEDALSLRLSGGERPLADVHGVIGVCSQGPTSATVWRKGLGDVVVVRASAARVGGIHGLREAASRVGLGPITTWVPVSDLGWDAASTLRASGVPSPEITVSTDGSAVTQARLLSLSMTGAMVRADAPDAWACEPALTRDSTDAVCVQSRALGWHVVGAVGKAGIAESAFPFWMSTFTGVTDPAAFRVELSLLELGRRLVAGGFEATTLEGVTETRDGALVTGRSGDDAIVAISLTRDAPWAAPCAEGGDGGAPSEDLRGVLPIRLAPGETSKLTCGGRGSEARDRKTVVFRHALGATAATGATGAGTP